MAVASEPKKRGRKPLGAPERVTLANIKGSPEYKAWLDDISAETMISLTNIIKDAIEGWAEERNLPAPPEGERVRKGRRKGGA